jgi:hypothetical protein
MSCDKLVFDLSQEVEGSPNVFIRKDWLNILDNQNQNYQNNQSIIDTSQLANSNKYMGFREAYLAVPLLVSLVVPANSTANVPLNTACDYAIGLKNWFGQIIHSMTLDYNGTTIVQQTPFCNMWNTFKLMTTLSWADIKTQGATIGFYPDTATSFYSTAALAADANGLNVCNNDLGLTPYQFSNDLLSTGMSYSSPAANIYYGGNYGATYRTSCINYRPTAAPQGGQAYQTFLTAGNSSLVWKSYISTPQNSVAAGVGGYLQISVMATIYLKHIHSFFNMCPLLKGVFMKMTMNLNNATTQLNLAAAGTIAGYTTSVFVGGVNPILIPSGRTGSTNAFIAGGAPRSQYYNISVGSTCTDNAVGTAFGGVGLLPGGNVAKSIYLYVPAYTFNPTFEQAYLSNNIKQIKYTDIYQYQVLNVSGNANGGQFNNLITNGIANIKSVLIIPFLKQGITTVGQPVADYNEWQSPFDTAGCGTTAPLTAIGNFNVQIAGQNAIYNMQRYTFEEWNNQLYGQNAVNGGLTDGLTSGLIDFKDFQSSYCYYYVNVERMLPVEQSVPKSVQILGTNYNSQPLNFWVFIEYGVQVSIDILTGARV